METKSAAAGDKERLRELLVAGHPAVAIGTLEEEYALGLLRELAGDSGWDLWLWSVSRGVRDGLISEAPNVTDTEHPAAALYYLTQLKGRAGIYVMLDLAGHLKDERTLRMLREAIASMRMRGESKAQLVLIDYQEELPPAIASEVTRFNVTLPSDGELHEIVKETLRQAHAQSPIAVVLNKQDLQTIVRNLRGLTRRQARQVIVDCISDDRRLDRDDINAMLARKRRAIGDGLLQYIEAPVSLDQIGGLAKLKDWLVRRQLCFSESAESFGLTPPRGVLLLGVQGSGKSLASKAVATAWQRPLLRLDAGSLYDRWIGESERRLRDALRQAEMMAPVVLWIDEIEKGFASAASQSADGGLSMRMFGHLLTWMQEHTAPVFLVATANDIAALPPELLRKGRFDEIFFVDLPTTEARRAIFGIHLGKRKRDVAKFDCEALAKASEGYSGAEIEQAIISALHDAFAANVELATKHLLEALKASPPLSVTMAERVAALRSWSKGRCVPAD